MIKQKYGMFLPFLLIVAAILTGNVVSGLVPLFDSICYGALGTFFFELLRSILWIAEIFAIHVFCKKRYHFSMLSNKETRGQELNNKNVLLLAVITIGCILLISSQIGFQVKPFYDLGEKFSGYELMGNVGILLGNIVKMFLVTMMLRTGQEAVEQAVGKRQNIIYGGMLLFATFGIYEFIIGQNYLMWTYLFLNLVFGAVYLLTDRSVSKTYLFLLAIYIF